MHAFFAKFRIILLLVLSLSAGMTASHAQLVSTDPDWKETDVPAPPVFDASALTRLVPFEVSPNSTLRWAVDPASVNITPDGLVRYVVVARSPSGVVNALYETINCGRAEFKTYARYNANSGWATVENPEWHSMYDKLPSKHALMLAKQGACVGNAAAQSADDIVRALKKTNSSSYDR